MKNKISVSLLCLSNINDIDNFFEILKKERIRYIELPISKVSKHFSYDLKKLKKFKSKMNKYSIKVSSIQSIFFNRDDLNIFNAKKHKLIINHIKKIFLISKFFKAKNVIFGSPRNRYLENENNLNNGIKIIKQIGKISNKYNINFCIEPNSKYYNCNFINKIEDAINFVKLINNKNVLINADTGNIFLEKDKCSNAKINKNLFSNFQISEKNLISLSKGSINHNQILKKFVLNNKFVSLEMLNTNLRDLGKDIKKFKKIISKI